jgi:hypothetical protein
VLYLYIYLTVVGSLEDFTFGHNGGQKRQTMLARIASTKQGLPTIPAWMPDGYVRCEFAEDEQVQPEVNDSNEGTYQAGDTIVIGGDPENYGTAGRDLQDAQSNKYVCTAGHVLDGDSKASFQLRNRVTGSTTALTHLKNKAYRPATP